MWHGGRPQPALAEALLPTPVSPPPGPARVLFPDEFTDDETDRVATPPKSQPAGRRIGRAAAYGSVGLLAGASLFLLGAVLTPSPAPPPAVEPGTAPALVLSPQARVDGLADTLALATGAFDLRLRLFQSHQMECPDLARGLVVVEERWAEYSAARTAGRVAQDSAHASLDRSLYAGVDATERQFEQSKCPRP